MRIGIIGAGNIGGNLTKRLSALGHVVKVANSRGPETLSQLAGETGALACSPSEAVSDAELIIVTIPQKRIPDLPPTLFQNVPKAVAVIDTGNYYPKERDGLIAEIEDGEPESVWVERHLGHSVIKAFNGIYSQHLLDRHLPAGTPGRIALPVAGDDQAAKKMVIGLIDELGFDAVDAGPLAESWRQQPGTPVYGADLGIKGVTEALSQAPKERPEHFRN